MEQTGKTQEGEQMNVVKKDGSSQPFDKNKIADGCKKSGASDDVAREVADAVSKKVEDGASTTEIGEMVIAELKKLDAKAGAAFEEYFRGR